MHNASAILNTTYMLLSARPLSTSGGLDSIFKPGGAALRREDAENVARFTVSWEGAFPLPQSRPISEAVEQGEQGEQDMCVPSH